MSKNVEKGDFSKLQTGMKFKNYKEMCTILGMDIKVGTNSKNAQYKTLAQYCEYEKQGHSIIIKKVFAEKGGRIDNRGGRYTDIYNSLTQAMLLNFFSDLKGSNITISRTRLLKEIAILNINYVECRENLINLSKYMDIPLDIIFEFYSVTNSNFKSIVVSALNTLQDKGLIKYHETTKVKSISTLKTRTATPEELAIIVECENETLKEMEYKNIRDARMSSKWKKFKELVSDKLKSHKTDIWYYYTAYDIGMVSNEKLEIALDELNANDTSNLTLNDTVQINLKRGVVQRYEDALGDLKDEKKSTRYRKQLH